MASFGARLAVILLLHVILLQLWVLPVQSDDEEDHLLQGINSFRQTSNAPVLTKHDKAECVADEIANRLEDQSCASNTVPTTQAQLMTNYASVLQKCKIDANSTRDGMILPVCVPHRVATLVLTNYTQSQNRGYLNDSRFTGAGIGTEDDWTVLVLTTSTPGGSFANGASRVGVVVDSGKSLFSLMLMLFLVLVY